MVEQSLKTNPIPQPPARPASGHTPPPRESLSAPEANTLTSPDQESEIQLAKPIPGADPISAEDASFLAEVMNRRVEFSKFKAEVSVDEGTKRYIIQIVARDSGRVIRQLPPEGILMLAEKLQTELEAGVLMDEQI